YVLFFFSSRRRHTRFSRDWSSDVCSSDLLPAGTAHTKGRGGASVSSAWPRPLACRGGDTQMLLGCVGPSLIFLIQMRCLVPGARSEERRVGKERSCRRHADH